MTRHFGVYEKKLLKRYNFRIFKANILPVCILLALAAIGIFSFETVMPVRYYRFFFCVSSVCIGYSFLTVLIGSAISTTRINGHKNHTFIEIDDKYLIVSRYIETAYFAPDPADYKELYIIRLSEIEDVYPFKKTVIVAAPTRKITGQAQWLDYEIKDGEVVLGRSWDSCCAGYVCGGVEIRDMFRYPKRISRTIERVCAPNKERSERYQAFREYMLSVTQSEAYKKARQKIKEKRQ